MNFVNVLHTIEIMKRAGRFDMGQWQVKKGQCQLKPTEEELHTCGMAACLGGWVAVSPEFIADGGHASDSDGRPAIHIEGLHYNGHHAIAQWLDIPVEHAHGLCGVIGNGTPFVKMYGTIYRINITKAQVTAKLEALRDWGEDSVQFLGDAYTPND